jgi:hypothetical protein
MTYLLQFCGVTDPLQLFYLEQSSIKQGPAFAGFRPFQLDDLLGWALETARGRDWNLETIHSTVVDVWLERAEAIRQWQQRLLMEPNDRRIVAGLGTQYDWERRCEAMLQA